MSYPRPPTPNWDLLKAAATYAGLILLDRVAYVVLAILSTNQATM